MSGVEDGNRELHISTSIEPEGVCVAVRDAVTVGKPEARLPRPQEALHGIAQREFKAAGRVDRRCFNRLRRRSGSLQRFKQATHFTNDARRDRIDFPIKRAKQEDSILKPLLQRSSDRCAEKLA
jgi:hypothetical protein